MSSLLPPAAGCSPCVFPQEAPPSLGSYGQVVDPETNKLFESFVVTLVPGEEEKENPKFTSHPLDLHQPTSTSTGLTTHSVLSQDLPGQELRSQELTWAVSKLILHTKGVYLCSGKFPQLLCRFPTLPGIQTSSILTRED